jgi:DNA-binding NtrC family response regulator
MAVLVLIVDDEVQVARALARVLTRNGYCVRTAHSGRQALESLDGVQLVISDVRMPGMSGTDLIDAVRRLHPAMRCALMSGFEGSDEPCDDADEDIARFSKPWDQNALLSKLAELAAQS